MLEIFDTFGNVRSDLDSLAADIEKLPDDKCARLSAVVDANAAKRDAEAKLAFARESVRTLEGEYHQAMATHRKYFPPVTFQDALQASIAANNGRAKPSGPDVKALAKKVADLEKRKRTPDVETELAAARKELAIAQLPQTVQAANDALAVGQAQVVRASRTLKDAERDNSEAIAAWIAINSDDRVTHESLVRAAAKADADRKLAKLASEPPKEGPVVWEKQRVMEARGALKKPRTYFGPK